MAPRKPFLLRLDPAVHDALASWAADELRSVNGHIEFLLRDALKRQGRAIVSREHDVPDRTADDAPAMAPAGRTPPGVPVVPPPMIDAEPQADGA